MSDIDDLFDVFDEANNDPVGLYLPSTESEAELETSK